MFNNVADAGLNRQTHHCHYGAFITGAGEGWQHSLCRALGRCCAWCGVLLGSQAWQDTMVTADAAVQLGFQSQISCAAGTKQCFQACHDTGLIFGTASNSSLSIPCPAGTRQCSQAWKDTVMVAYTATNFSLSKSCAPSITFRHGRI